MAELVKFGRGSQETYESNWEETMQDFVYFAEDTQTIFMNGKEYSACCEACLEWEDTGDYNYIVMLDGTIHEIDDIDEFCLSGNEEETQTFTSDGSSLTVTKEDIKEVHASLPVSSTNYWCNELFYSWTNLTTADIVFKYSTITSSGNYFGFYMFYNCNSLTTINKDFTLPQSFTTVGSHFCSNMFWKCSSLAELPKNFNLPQKLITVGDCFTCSSVYNTESGFLRDTLITKLPSKFNIPQDIESVGQQFCGNLISGCAYLEELPDGFNLPQKLTTVPAAFCGGMTASLEIGFARGCTSLKKLPKGFNLPPNLTSVGAQFCNSMFDNCTSLEELPEGFNFPQGITSVGDNFAGSMFINCSALKAFPEGFTFPQGITGKVTSFGYGQAPYGGRGGTFSGCSSIKKFPDGFNLPQNITELGNYSFGQIYSSGMFQGCSSLEELPEGFNLPQNVTKVGSRVFNNMFSNCTSLKRLPDGFNLPPVITETGEEFCSSMFSGCSALETLPDGFSIPQNVESINNNYCYNMFSGCSSLTQLPDSFNISPAITDGCANFCQNMFLNCTSLKTLPNDFNVPQNMESAGSNYCSGFFNGCSSLQPGTDVAVTFVFDATNCMSNTQFTPTSAEAGQTYYIKGNYDIVKTSFNIDISIGDIFTDDSGSVTFTGFTTSDGVTYQFDSSITLHNGESGSVSFQASGEISSITGGIIGEYNGTIDGDTLGIWINESNSKGESTVEEAFNGSITGSFNNNSNTYEVDFVNTIVIQVDTDRIMASDSTYHVWGTHFHVSSTGKEYQHSNQIIYRNNHVSQTTFYIPGRDESILGYLRISTGQIKRVGIDECNYNINDLYFNGELQYSNVLSTNVISHINSSTHALYYLTTQTNSWKIVSTAPDATGYVYTADTQYPIDDPTEFSLSSLWELDKESGSYSYIDFSIYSEDTLTFISNGLYTSVNRDTIISIDCSLNSTTANTHIFAGVGYKLFNNLINCEYINISTLGNGKSDPTHNNIYKEMFSNCSKLKSVTGSLKLPSNITNPGDDFCASMFYNCTSLESIPSDISFPENLESVGENFGKDMFYNCSSLQPGEVALTFPFEAEDAFVNTQFTPTTAAAGSTYYIKGNNEA